MFGHVFLVVFWDVLLFKRGREFEFIICNSFSHFYSTQPLLHCIPTWAQGCCWNYEIGMDRFPFSILLEKIHTRTNVNSYKEILIPNLVAILYHQPWMVFLPKKLLDSGYQSIFQTCWMYTPQKSFPASWAHFWHNLFWEQRQTWL